MHRFVFVTAVGLLSACLSAAEPEPLELSPGQLAELLRALDRVQGERDEAREGRRARAQAVEKDW